jgi:CBS domain-containing protein
MTRTIEEILKTVSIRDVLPPRFDPVEPATSLGDAIRLLDEQGRGALVVCEARRVVGIFTERDVLRDIAGNEVDLATPVSRFMTKDPTCIGSAARLAEAISTMIEGGYRNLPLVDESGDEEGMLSSLDVVQFVADHYSKFVKNLPPRLHQRMTAAEGG